MNPIPKLKLGLYPTPLQELTGLSSTLGGGKRLFLKREDLCGVGFGGNKIRKAEYLLAEALGQGCDCIITGGGTRSNQPIAVAACAGRTGIPACLVMPEQTSPLIFRILELFGAEIHTVAAGKQDGVGKAVRQLAKERKSRGEHPYVIPPGASVVQGVLGYVDAMEELYRQAESLGISIDHVVCCGATGNTYAGVALGTKLYSPFTTATAISIARRFCHKSTLCRMAEEAAVLLGVKERLTEDDLHIHFSCGKGAGVETVKGTGAVKRMAGQEGVLLDPVYTGKAFAGIFDLNQSGYFADGQTIVFIHTGGMAALLGSL